jgi:hypothetical protein
LCVASHNERILRKWHGRTGLGDPTHPLLLPDQETHGFMFFTAKEAAAIHEELFGCTPTAAA